MTRSPGINAMLAEAQPGFCICCDRPLPPRKPGPGRPRVMCPDVECRRLYLTVWVADRAARERQARHARGLLRRGSGRTGAQENEPTNAGEVQ